MGGREGGWLGWGDEEAVSHDRDAPVPQVDQPTRA